MSTQDFRHLAPLGRSLPALGMLFLLLLSGLGARAAAAAPGSGDPCPDSAFSAKAQAVLVALATVSGPGDFAWGKSCNNTSATLLQAPDPRYWGVGAAALPAQLSCDPGTDPSCEPDFGLYDCTAGLPGAGPCNCAPVESTDPDRGGQRKVKSLCVGHSDSLYDEVYQLVRGAKKQVDITTLTKVDGQFLAALANAITYLNGVSSKNSGIQVRFLYGFSATPPLLVLHELTKGLPLNPGQWNIRVSAALYDGLGSLEGFNHSKIIAVDGKRSIVGGINMWSDDYLGSTPVHDLWLKVEGDAAVSAHEYASGLWIIVCGVTPGREIGLGPGGNECLAGIGAAGGGPTKGSVRVIGIGRAPLYGSNASDVALYAMADAAQRSVLISQQSLVNPVLPALRVYDGSLLGSLYDAMVRGAGVDVVVSNASPQPSTYSAGLSPEEIFADLWSRMEDRSLVNPPPAGYSSFGELLCSKLRVAPLRRSTAGSSGYSAANHAKFMMVDDELFYVGSQNLYPASIADFGYVVDDPAAAFSVKLDYWDQLWRYSQTAVARGGTIGGGLFGTDRDVLCAPFNRGQSPTATQRPFSGDVTIKASGTGHMAGDQYNDAFYIYADPSGNPYNPPVRWDTLLMINGNKAIKGTSPSYPAYDPGHVYEFHYSAPGGPLFFANNDVLTSDNSGTYAIEVAQ